jgi:hypothetical protein
MSTIQKPLDTSTIFSVINWYMFYKINEAIEIPSSIGASTEKNASISY